ncbi:hypothetical protein IVB03_31515 [Bradyrhizobium sp. 168]|uniref:hypothetical protein n=1 Tax=Bradyrhizobium sp. 168 TaxID=2782639 RepID=UPI001FF8BD8A|nr:hypothetical protein [Bradyrhizobium sp. 168]MCK1583961.1 hypothetical protein [Bradyrhizobium sp. 168]
MVDLWRAFGAASGLFLQMHSSGEQGRCIAAETSPDAHDSAISIGDGRKPAALTATTAGKVGAAEDEVSSSTIAGTNTDLHRMAACTLHGFTQTRSPEEYLLGTETLTACHLRAVVPRPDSRRRSPRFRAPTTCAEDDTNDHLLPLRTCNRPHLLGVVLTVNTMVKTIGIMTNAVAR